MSMEEELAKRLEGFNGRQAKVGWLESARYTENGQNISVASVAIIQEFGAPGANIPPRPFIRPTFNAQKEKWTRDIEKGVKAVMRGATTPENVLTIVGQTAAGDLINTLSSGAFTALSPVTLMLRKWSDADKNFKKSGKTVGAAAAAVAAGEDYSTPRTQPLHDTGHMIATCTSIVGNVE